ncbi:MAG: hypothetical protein ACKV2Q_05760 [Planctomycetaceae bacterium]
MTIPDHITKLIGPGLWRPLIADMSSVARSVLQSLHDRHIGITPNLAVDLASYLTRSSGHWTPRIADDPWSAVIIRLRKALHARSQEGRFSDSQGGRSVMISAAPTYFVFRVAAFLIDRASSRIGRTLLFCEDRVLFGRVSAEDYASYERELITALTDIARDESPELDLFWREAAAALSSRARRLASSSRDVLPLPHTVPVSLALFHRLRPQVSDEEPDRRKVRRMQQTQPIRTIRRHRKTDGINGVTISRSPDDLNDMMLSEMLMPKALRLHRMMNEGFLVRLRPPKREQNRDVLLAVLVPGEVRDSILGAFIKACWFDLCLRLGQRLCQSRMFQSEFRLIEGNRLGLSHTETFPLSALTSPEFAEGTEPSAVFRHDFMNSLHWLPRFLNERAVWSEPVPQKGKGVLPSGDSLADWAVATWRSQVEQPTQTLMMPGSPMQDATQTRRRKRRPSRGGLNLDDFKFIHLMVVCPSREEATTTSYHALGHRLLKGVRSNMHLSVMRVPAELSTVAEWVFETEGGRRQTIQAGVELEGDALSAFNNLGTNGSGGVDPVARFAGALVGAWLGQIQREVWHG